MGIQQKSHVCSLALAPSADELTNSRPTTNTEDSWHTPDRLDFPGGGENTSPFPQVI